MSIWGKVCRALFTYPAPQHTILPDMTGARVNMQFLMNTMHENKKWPAVGDIIIELQTCGMGMTIRKDTRYRVTALRSQYESAIKAENVITGERQILYIFYMRELKSIPRVWLLAA